MSAGEDGEGRGLEVGGRGGEGELGGEDGEGVGVADGTRTER